MSAPKSAVTKAIQELRRQADAMDLRRRKQIANQTATINRLLDNPSATDEIAKLNEQLAEAQARIEELS